MPARLAVLASLLAGPAAAEPSLEAAFAAASALQRGPADLFAGAPECAFAAAGEAAGWSRGYLAERLGRCAGTLSDDLLYVEPDSDPVTLWIMFPSAARGDGRIEGDLHYTLSLHAPGGRLGPHPVALKRVNVSLLQERIISCLKKDDPYADYPAAAEAVRRTEACLKAMPDLGLAELRVEGGRVKARTTAGDGVRAALRGALLFADGAPYVRFTFVDVLP